MSKNGKKRGGRSQSQRMKRQMAKTDKPINNNEADAHMGKTEQLRKDAIDNLRHINKVRELIGLPKFEAHDEGMATPEEADLGDVAVEEAHDKELVDADLIVCVRLFDTDKDGRLVGKRTDAESFCARHREVRRTRNRYREIGGALVQAGKPFGVRKEKARKRKERSRNATAVLKSIMVRLMPHEAELAAGLKESDIAKAVDAVALAYQEETRCEIVSAAVHRMVDSDLHIHLQYTMILGREEKDGELARRVAAWKRDLTAKARELLRKDGHPDPAPARIGKVKNQLLKDGVVEPKPEHAVVYQRVPGKRSMRDDSILGYSFRNKLNLVRAAEACGEHELAHKVAKKNDHRDLFLPISRKGDEQLNQQYRDLWLERLWRSQVVSMLPKTKYTKLKELGLHAAKRYEAYGTTRVEETHLVEKIRELDKRAGEIEEQSSKLEKLKSEVSQRVEKLEMEVAELRAHARVDAERRLEMNTRIAELEGEADFLREEVAQEKSAKEDLAKNLETTRAISAHQLEILNNAYEEAKTERDGFKGQVDELTQQLSQDKTAKRDLEKDYSKVCEERDLLQVERDGFEADLEDSRGRYADSESELAKRDAAIKSLEKENRVLRLMESKYHALVELVRAFVVKLLGKREIMKELRYDDPLSGAFGAMFHEASGMSLEEFTQKFEAPPKIAPPPGQDDKSKDNKPTDPERP